MIAQVIGGVEQRGKGFPSWGDMRLEHLVDVRSVARLLGSLNRHRLVTLSSRGRPSTGGGLERLKERDRQRRE
jgi:hypothetical protein